MTSDITDFVRGRLGSPIPINMAAINRGVVVGEIVDAVQAINPRWTIEFQSNDDLNGNWDVQRLKQMVSNLLINAIRHGTGQDTQVIAKSHEGIVVLQVHNQGPPIPDNKLATMFHPLVQAATRTIFPQVLVWCFYRR